MKKLVLFSILILCAYLTVYGHSGRTDANGGHYNRSTGEYHYHHGYSAHSHINGKCPYDFDDQTNHGGATTIRSQNSSTDFSFKEILIHVLILLFYIACFVDAYRRGKFK